jgi:hypothetical protein
MAASSSSWLRETISPRRRRSTIAMFDPVPSAATRRTFLHVRIMGQLAEASGIGTAVQGRRLSTQISSLGG